MNVLILQSVDVGYAIHHSSMIQTILHHSVFRMSDEEVGSCLVAPLPHCRGQMMLFQDVYCSQHIQQDLMLLSSLAPPQDAAASPTVQQLHQCEVFVLEQVPHPVAGEKFQPGPLGSFQIVASSN